MDETHRDYLVRDSLVKGIALTRAILNRYPGMEIIISSDHVKICDGDGNALIMEGEDDGSDIPNIKMMGIEDVRVTVEKMIAGKQLRRLANLMGMEEKLLRIKIHTGSLLAHELFVLSYFCGWQISAEDRYDDMMRLLLSETK